MRKIKILIADDHAVVRQGTRKLLEQESDLEVVAEACDGEKAVEMAIEFAPDIAMMDVAMPNLDGIEATKQIKTHCPDTKVLVLSAYDDDQFVFSLLEAGAAGYLLKSVHTGELVAAIRAIYEGGFVFHPSITEKVLSRSMSSSGKSRHKVVSGDLNEREVAILKMMSKGMANKNIADDLCISIRTVQGHLSQIFRKLRVSSRMEAVVYALKGGLITVDDMLQEESIKSLTVWN